MVFVEVDFVVVLIVGGLWWNVLLLCNGGDVVGGKRIFIGNFVLLVDFSWEVRVSLFVVWFGDDVVWE